MPLFFNKILSEEIHYMVWELTESMEELTILVQPNASDLETLSQISSDPKKVEYLAGKNAIMQMCLLENIPFRGIFKDEHGKPFLLDHSIEISLTHTINYIGVAFSRKGPIGMDIEKPRQQIFKVLNRLCIASEVDWVANDLERATILWSAKEALYKLYGKRKVDFKENLLVLERNNELIGKIKITDYEAEHQIFIEKLGEYLLILVH